jgi:hypothetical protein
MNIDSNGDATSITDPRCNICGHTADECLGFRLSQEARDSERDYSLPWWVTPAIIAVAYLVLVWLNLR